MNQGSSLSLALAVHRAGAFPSLFLGGLPPLNYDEIRSTLETFRTETGRMDVVIALDRAGLFDKKLIGLIIEYSPSHIELLPSDANGHESTIFDFLSMPNTKLALKTLRTRSKLILRLYQPLTDDIAKNFDGFYIKGLESAGKTSNWAVKDLFVEQRKLTPNIPIIPYGGIGTPEQVKWYISNGAPAVGVGTLFAACSESPLSTEVKQKITNINSSDLTRIKDTKQNCLVMGQTTTEGVDWNNTDNLVLGVNGKGNEGLVYLGRAVDYITHIRTAKETVDYLCSKL